MGDPAFTTVWNVNGGYSEYDEENDEEIHHENGGYVGFCFDTSDGISIDWGDGEVLEQNSPDILGSNYWCTGHNYMASGEYVVKIS